MPSSSGYYIFIWVLQNCRYNYEWYQEELCISWWTTGSVNDEGLLGSVGVFIGWSFSHNWTSGDRWSLSLFVLPSTACGFHPCGCPMIEDGSLAFSVTCGHKSITRPPSYRGGWYIYLFIDWFLTLFFFSFWSCHMACRILAPWPGIEPAPFALEVQS